MGKSDIDIARSAELKPIADVARSIGLAESEIEPYGSHKAKVKLEALERRRADANGALVLVTAMTPTPAGEGKTTTTVGLAEAFRRIGRRAIVAIREPSLGPCFGVKGGAAGGGHAQVVPMEDINLHFTGDLHAVTAAHNLLAALIDNHLFHGNGHRLDSRRVLWKRVLDMNDRALRNTLVGLGGPLSGVPRESGFEITVASEIMAILCLASDLRDLRARLGRIVVGETADGTYVTASELKAAGALTVLLKDALKPNLVQTLDGTPAFVHGGPFGNIAHGCSSLVATRLALKLADVVVTEAGFGSDLGAEKFFDIKCRIGHLTPAAAVLVATVRALKLHGGVAKADLDVENVPALERGIANLEKHIDNVRQFRVPVVVAINRFLTDTDAEIAAVLRACAAANVPARVSQVWEYGGAGGVEVAEATVEAMRGGTTAAFQPLYPDDLPLSRKLEMIAKAVYGADGINLLPAVADKLSRFERCGFRNLPVCVAKTQNSLSDDPKKLGRPRGFEVLIRDARLSAGAGFVVAYAGDVMTMPGLPKEPSAEIIDIDGAGNTIGLF
jgi:formate--tetrahydrofolate ligase